MFMVTDNVRILYMTLTRHYLERWKANLLVAFQPEIIAGLLFQIDDRGEHGRLAQELTRDLYIKNRALFNQAMAYYGDDYEIRVKLQTLITKEFIEANN